MVDLSGIIIIPIVFVKIPLQGFLEESPKSPPAGTSVFEATKADFSFVTSEEHSST
jgi:hypothetical protein